MLRSKHTRAIPEILERMRETTVPSRGVLSVYLATPPERVLSQGHLLALRDACKEARSTIAASGRESFEAARELVETYLTNEWEATQHGVAVFASEDPAYFFVAPLPSAPADRVFWASQPHIAELQLALDEYERIAVALVDKEHARLYTVFLGEIEQQLAFEDYVPGKQATGDWHALAQTRFARHHEEQVLRHVHHIVESLELMKRAHPFRHLLLAGPDEAITMLRQYLPATLRNTLAGTIEIELFASDAEVLTLTLAAAEQIERRQERASVAELLEANSRFAARGVTAVLDALGEGRVHLLFMMDRFSGQGSECPSCHRMWAVTHERCPVCGESMAPIGDLRERIVERALFQGAQVDLVAGDAADQLSAVGGLAAWTRY